MDILKDINDQSNELDSEESIPLKEPLSIEEEEVIESEIGNVLRYSGYNPESDEWKSAMFRWKRRRTTKPRMYRKFVDLD